MGSRRSHVHTEGLKRGMEIPTGAAIPPVGAGVMGRVLDVTGSPVDERGPVEADKHYPIHRQAPPLTEQATSAELLTTGIKVIDLICPFLKGGKVAFGAGVGKPWSSWTINNIAKLHPVIPCSRVSVSVPVATISTKCPGSV